MKIKIAKNGIGEARWSDKEIADAAKISRPSITRWRNNDRQPAFASVRQVEDAMGLPFQVITDKHMTTNKLREAERRLLLQLSNIAKLIEKIGDAELLYSKQNTETNIDLSGSD